MAVLNLAQAVNQALDLALADERRGTAHALAMGSVEAVRLHDFQLEMGRP